MYKNNTNTRMLKKITREKAFDLAEGGQIAHAIVMWNKHKCQFDDCVCDNGLFDQKLCGFCLLSGLQTESLKAVCRASAERYLVAAETVSTYLTKRSCAIAGLVVADAAAE